MRLAAALHSLFAALNSTMRGLPAGPGGPLRKSNGRSPASLGADIEEIDALLAASKRARTSVAERASKLMSEHAAVQRGFERELDREALRQKPKEKLKRRSGADHALLFHLSHAPDQPADEAAAAAAERPRRRKPEESPPPDDAVIPPPPSYASETEAREWDEYYRFCARGALFKALDRGRDAEDGAARRLAETMAELDLRHARVICKVYARGKAYEPSASQRGLLARPDVLVHEPRPLLGASKE